MMRRRRGATVRRLPQRRPLGVQIVHRDGTATPVELAHVGIDEETGCDVWQCVTPLRVDDKLTVALLPSRCTIVAPVVDEGDVA